MSRTNEGQIELDYTRIQDQLKGKYSRRDQIIHVPILRKLITKIRNKYQCICHVSEKTIYNLKREQWLRVNLKIRVNELSNKQAHNIISDKALNMYIGNKALRAVNKLSSG